MSPSVENNGGEDSKAITARELNGTLPSGRSIVVKAVDTGEEIEVRSPTGEIEVSIAFTDKGPIMKLHGGRLEINSAETVVVNCRRFEVNASEALLMRSEQDVGIAAGGEIRVKSAGETFIDGDMVNLNCLDRKGYHDYEGNGATGGEPAALPPGDSTGDE